jgi:hypothetical protein
LWVDPLAAEFLLNLATTNMSYPIAKNITMVENFLPVAILSGPRISLHSCRTWRNGIYDAWHNLPVSNN